MFENNTEYDNLSEYSSKRFQELSKMYKPYMNVTDQYGKLICRIINLLGKTKPKNEIEQAIRDLASDIFDALYESRNLIISGKSTTSYPLARRAYESISLMIVCSMDHKLAKDWIAGKQINNQQIRQYLSKHPMGEDKDTTRGFYKFFSSASHPNRNLIPYRYLGEGNEFVLGSIGKPDLIITTDFCIKHLSLWYWYVAFFVTFYHDLIQKNDISIDSFYMRTATEAKQVNKWLKNNFNQLISKDQNTF